MKARIHHGAHEVGGNCIELAAADGSRTLLDLGRPLSAGPADVVPLPDIAPDATMLGVLITHPHLDHYGLVDQLPIGVPTYLGREATAVINAATFFSPLTTPFTPTAYLADRVPIELGPFTITPFLADHSGFDAYSLLIEADGRRLFYTGDFRGHGRKARLFEELLAAPPGNVDVLIAEGTQIGGSDRGELTESDLEHALVERCADTNGLVTVLGSAQNLDRIVTVFRAARRSDRIFVTDLYAATVAAAARSTIPQPGFDRYRVYVPQRQRLLVKDAREFDRVATIRDVRVFGEQLAADPGRYVAYLPSSSVSELIKAGTLTSTGLVLWSMWDGYLEEPSGVRLTAELRAAGIEFGDLHTSGHATVADLKRLIDAIDPTAVVPIHSQAPEKFTELSSNVALHADGEWWTV